MDANTSELLNAAFRWIHVVAGVLWIGLLYFFNWINGAVAATFDADTKKKVVPELLPRTLYWFRWGAAFTWISGILLMGIVYYMGGALLPADSTMSVGQGTGLGLGLLVVGFLVYDLLWKSPLASNEHVGMVISLALTVGVAYGLNQVFSGRAAYIHIGALFGTLMAGNVWMRIWPAQRKIIKATVDGSKPEAAWGAMAKLRSKHNTYMSVPLIFLMVSNHYPTIYGSVNNWVLMGGIVGGGWLVTKWLYIKSGSAATKSY